MKVIYACLSLCFYLCNYAVKLISNNEIDFQQEGEKISNHSSIVKNQDVSEFKSSISSEENQPPEIAHFYWPIGKDIFCFRIKTSCKKIVFKRQKIIFSLPTRMGKRNTHCVEIPINSSILPNTNYSISLHPTNEENFSNMHFFINSNKFYSLKSDFKQAPLQKFKFQLLGLSKSNNWLLFCSHLPKLLYIYTHYNNPEGNNKSRCFALDSGNSLYDGKIFVSRRPSGVYCLKIPNLDNKEEIRPHIQGALWYEKETKLSLQRVTINKGMVCQVASQAGMTFKKKTLEQIASRRKKDLQKLLAEKNI